MSMQCKESGKTRSRILHAAKKEFAARGFNGARMGSIADIAGVNQALLHYHFAGKENIYKEVILKLIKDFFKIYDERIRSEIESWGAEPDVKLCSLIYVIINSELYIRDDEFHRILAFEIAEGDGIIHELVRDYLLPQVSSVDEIIRDGIRKGIFQISNSKMFAGNILSFIRHLAHGVDFFKGTDLYDQIYRNNHDGLYHFMAEFTFKALRPEGRELIIPVLDDGQKSRLDSMLKIMKDDLEKF